MTPDPALSDPAAAALADALRAETPYAVLDAPAPALEAALAMLGAADVAIIRLRNPLSAPLSLERAVIQLAPFDVEDEAEASPPEDDALRVVRALAVRSAGSTALLVVVEQAETLTHGALALLQLLPRLRAPGTPPVRVAFVGTHVFRTLLADPRFAPIRDNQSPGPEFTVPADAGPGADPSPAAPSPVPFAPIPFAPEPFRPDRPSTEAPARSAAQPPAEPLPAPSPPAAGANLPRRRLAAVAGAGALAAIALVLLSYPRAPSPAPPQSSAARPVSPPQPTTPQPTPAQSVPAQSISPQPISPQPSPPQPTPSQPAPPPAATDAPGSAPPPPALPEPGSTPASPPATSPPTVVDQQAARARLFAEFNAFVDRSGMAGRLSPADRATLFREYLTRRYAAAHPHAPASTMLPGSQSAPLPATPPPETGLDVVLLFPAAVPGAEAEALAEVARLGTSFPNITVRATAKPLPDATIRYFRAEDRDLALTLALSLPPANPDWQVVDLSAAPEKPLRPTVEVWLPPPPHGVIKP